MIKVGIIMLGILVLTSLTLIGTLFLDQIACEGQPINDNVDPTRAQQIWGERIIGQSFVAPRNGLNRVDIVFQTYQRQNTHNVSFRLLEVSESVDNPLHGAEINSIVFSAADISDNSWHTFTFPPLSDSRDKTYLIALHSPESRDGNAITVAGIQRDAYAPGSAFLGPTPVAADITFRTCYRMTISEKLQVLSEQITRNRPILWGNISFYLFALGVYVLLLVGFFWTLVKYAR